MMNRSGIETYELLRLDEVALAGYFDLEDTRFEEWYEKNRAVGDRRRDICSLNYETKSV